LLSGNNAKRNAIDHLGNVIGRLTAHKQGIPKKVIKLAQKRVKPEK